MKLTAKTVSSKDSLFVKYSTRCKANAASWRGNTEIFGSTPRRILYAVSCVKKPAAGRAALTGFNASLKTTTPKATADGVRPGLGTWVRWHTPLPLAKRMAASEGRDRLAYHLVSQSVTCKCHGMVGAGVKNGAKVQLSMNVSHLLCFPPNF